MSSRVTEYKCAYAKEYLSCIVAKALTYAGCGDVWYDASSQDGPLEGPSAGPAIAAAILQRIAADVKFRPFCVLGEVDLLGQIWPTGNQRAKVQVGDTDLT
jgi:hypothetical protein